MMMWVILFLMGTSGMISERTRRSTRVRPRALVSFIFLIYSYFSATWPNAWGSGCWWISDVVGWKDCADLPVCHPRSLVISSGRRKARGRWGGNSRRALLVERRGKSRPQTGVWLPPTHVGTGANFRGPNMQPPQVSTTHPRPSVTLAFLFMCAPLAGSFMILDTKHIYEFCLPRTF